MPIQARILNEIHMQNYRGSRSESASQPIGKYGDKRMKTVLDTSGSTISDEIYGDGVIFKLECNTDYWV